MRLLSLLGFVLVTSSTPAIAQSAQPPENAVQFLKTEIYVASLHNAEADEVVAILAKVGLPDGVLVITSDRRTNTLVMRASPEGRKALNPILIELDRSDPPAPPPDRAHRLFLLHNARIEDVINMIKMSDLSTGSVRMLPYPPDNSLIVQGSDQEIEDLKDLIRFFDTPPKQKSTPTAKPMKVKASRDKSTRIGKKP